MIKVEFCGYNMFHSNKHFIYRPNGLMSSYLFLMFLTPMVVHFPDHTSVKAEPGSCLLYAPKYFQHYEAVREFGNHFIHFVCDNSTIENYNIPLNKPINVRNRSEIDLITKKVYNEFYHDLAKSDEMLDLYIRELLIYLQREKQLQQIPPKVLNEIYPLMQSLRSQMMYDCQRNWTIDEMCKIVNMGRSQFYKHYQDLFQNPPKDDLLQARLQKAKYLLSSDTIPIQQVACECGFPTISHFNRFFKQNCGVSPSQYRSSARSMAEDGDGSLLQN